MSASRAGYPAPRLASGAMATDRGNANLVRREGPSGGPEPVPPDAHGSAGDEAAGGGEQEAECDEAAGGGEQEAECDEADARRRTHGEPHPERSEAGEGQPQGCGCASPRAAPFP